MSDAAAMLRLALPAALWHDLKAHGLLAPGVPIPEEAS